MSLGRPPSPLHQYGSVIEARRGKSRRGERKFLLIGRVRGMNQQHLTVTAAADGCQGSAVSPLPAWPPKPLPLRAAPCRSAPLSPGQQIVLPSHLLHITGPDALPLNSKGPLWSPSSDQETDRGSPFFFVCSKCPVTVTGQTVHSSGSGLVLHHPSRCPVNVFVTGSLLFV